MRKEKLQQLSITSCSLDLEVSLPVTTHFAIASQVGNYHPLFPEVEREAQQLFQLLALSPPLGWTSAPTLLFYIII